MKEITKSDVQALIDFVNKKGNTMTIADIANVNENIDSIYQYLEDSEADFPNKNVVIGHLWDLKNGIRKTPYFNLVSTILSSLSRILCFLS